MTDVKEAGTRKKVRTSLNGVKEIPETPQGSFYAEDAAGMGVNMDVERTESFQEAPVRNGRTVVFRGNGEVKEVKETPHARRVGLGVPPVGFVEKHTVFPTSIPSSEPAVMSDAAPAPFPASTRLASAKHDTEMPTLSPEEEGEESLHWSDSEITGHDPSDPEDDGEGINGIGFKPTAAMARSRAEKRRRQLAEYKSREDREAREARAKRLAARKAAARGDGEGGREANSSEEERRRVRFEGVERAIDVL